MSLLGSIFADFFKEADNGFIERLLGDGVSGFLNDDAAFDLFLVGLNIDSLFGFGGFDSPYSQEDRDNALPPVLPGTPLDPQILILPDPRPEVLTEFMQDMFVFLASNNVDPADYGWTYQGYDSYGFMV